MVTMLQGVITLLGLLGGPRVHVWDVVGGRGGAAARGSVGQSIAGVCAQESEHAVTTVDRIYQLVRPFRAKGCLRSYELMASAKGAASMSGKWPLQALSSRFFPA